MPKKQTEESNILKTLCDYLAIKNYVFWRQNNIPIFDARFGGYRAMPKHCRKGVSDIILLKNGEAWFLEVKGLKKKQSADQIEFQKLVEKGGAFYRVVRSIDDLQKIGI